jgi:hypothetical protein
VVLNAWFDGGLGDGLRVGERRRLLLTVGPWSEASMLERPESDPGSGEIDPDATFRFVVNAGYCWVRPVRSAYAVDVGEPAEFEVSLIAPPPSGEVGLVIAIQREGVVLHVERLTVVSAQERGAHG